jgi:hypothetical protein
MDVYKPLGKRNVTLKDLGSEFLIYSSEQKAMHVLNPTAHLIWDLCDGEHTISEIEREVQSHFKVPQGMDLKGDIQRTLDVFQSKGLLENKANLP